MANCVNLVSAHTWYLGRWAAYVAGTLLVLMRELGTRFLDSISILVCSHLAYI